MNRVLVSGGTGFIGRHLVQALIERGDSVTVLSRSADPDLPKDARAVRWEPTAAGPWVRELHSHDAIVHLAGAQAVGARYTAAAKREMIASRVESTRVLVQAISDAEQRPKVLVCASAVGYYGAHPPEEILDESSAPGKDFLADLTRKWEATAEEAEQLGVRVVRVRFGIVLGGDGGALEKMAVPFKMFVGGPIGSGEQVVSWVHIDDVVAILLLAIDNDKVRGPLNAVAPQAVSNAELSRAIGNVLGRPSWLPVPGIALKILYGEGAEPLITGQRVAPRALQALGYVWRYKDIQAAVANALGADAEASEE